MGSKKFYMILGWILTAFSILALLFQGIGRSYFHQDDVYELAAITNWKWWASLTQLNNEHLNTTFWPFLRAQWLLFGINFTPYLIINILLHITVLILLFLITYKLTKSLFWSSLPVWGMVINANWFTVVWWVTGQMIMLSTIFALTSYLLILIILEHKQVSIWLYILLFFLSILPGLSWGVGLSWPLWPLLIYGINFKKKKLNNIGKTLLLAQISMAIIYYFLIGNNLSVHSNPSIWLTNPIAIGKFIIVGLSNTLVGRWLWPPEMFRSRMLILIVTSLIFIATKPWKKIIDKHVIFGGLTVIGCFLTYAIPRWTFGVGHAMANYYAYFPLTFLLISFTRFCYLYKFSRIGLSIVLAVFVVHIPLSWIGFEGWASEWVIRPQQTKMYFQELDKTVTGTCLDNVYIPKFIVPIVNHRIDHIWPIFNKDFSPFCK